MGLGREAAVLEKEGGRKSRELHLSVSVHVSVSVCV